MLIKELHVKPTIEEKILRTHGLKKAELETVLWHDEPKYFKAGKGRYLSIGLSQRLVTIIFEYAKGAATIITAYPSSKWQRRVYERK